MQPALIIHIVKIIQRKISQRAVIFLWLFIQFFILQPPTSPAAAPDAILFDIHEKGYQMMKLGYYNDAAIIWITDARAFMVSGDILDKQRAGILHVMATIAFEKEGNVEAYATWSDAIRYFLEGQTNWDNTQKALRRAFNALDHDLQSASVTGPAGGPAITPNAKELIWLEMEKMLHITSYPGPQPGLKSAQTTRKVNEQPKDARYVPRPFAATKRADTPVQENGEGIIRRGIPIEQNAQTKPPASQPILEKQPDFEQPVARPAAPRHFIPNLPVSKEIPETPKEKDVPNQNLELPFEKDDVTTD